MKPDAVNKLYKQLTAKELGNLAIEAIHRLDDKEADLILNSVERKTYVGADLDYSNRIRGFERLALMYGLQFWKTHALATLALKHYADKELLERRPDLEAVTEEAFNVMVSKLASMELALNQVCEQAQLDINAVKWFAECDDATAFNFDLSEDEATEKQTAYFVELFSLMVTVFPQ